MYKQPYQKYISKYSYYASSKQDDIPIKCEHPRIIVRRNLERYYNVIDFVSWNGERYYDYMQYLSKLLLAHKAVPYMHYEDIDNYYIHTIYGEDVPIFLVVRCGRCYQCRMLKSQDIVQRLNFESFYSKTIFTATLTYSPSHLPAPTIVPDSNGNKVPLVLPVVRDCQLFFKRLRKRNHTPFRYYLISEYGEKKGRLHYHCIFFIREKLEYFAARQFISDVYSSWQHGSTKCKMPVLNNNSPFRYVSEYLCKMDDWKSDYMIRLSSRGQRNTRFKGIGYAYINEYLRSRLYDDLCPVDQLTYNMYGKSERVLFSRYVSNVLFPTISIDYHTRVMFSNWYYSLSKSQPSELGFSWSDKGQFLLDFKQRYNLSCSRDTGEENALLETPDYETYLIPFVRRYIQTLSSKLLKERFVPPPKRQLYSRTDIIHDSVNKYQQKRKYVESHAIL